MQPKRDHPYVEGYGMDADFDESKMLTWEWVIEQTTKSRSYWICTVTAGNKAHATPIWAVWYADALYFGVGRSSRKGRNLATNPNVTIHLESGDEVVIFEGTVEEVADETIQAGFFKLYAEKYSYDPSGDADANSAYYRLNPVKVLAWHEHDFLNTAARFSFLNL